MREKKVGWRIRMRGRGQEKAENWSIKKPVEK